MLAAAPAHVKAAVQQSIREHRGSGGYEVLPPNWHAAKVFQSMGTQWQTKLGARGLIYEGLRYEALPLPLAEHRRIAHRQPVEVLMPQLRLMELEARDALNSR